MSPTNLGVGFAILSEAVEGPSGDETTGEIVTELGDDMVTETGDILVTEAYL